MAWVPTVAPQQKTVQLLDNIFTARQAAVIDALRRGKANKIIAYELNMRESTVKVHVRNIMKKLNAKNRTEVAYRANELLGPGRAT
jgi:DNA-binding NarL/FixJ family response regulator